MTSSLFIWFVEPYDHLVNSERRERLFTIIRNHVFLEHEQDI